ncbi:MFS transporter [Legionella londiniensis]|uniref:Proline/betaine transporter ProP6 n=1 Tax=Legionella londiniensis TaxID=45068 RepID=A0A0W0VHW5_9GAMM|nr:MFS transporter [Legionella londiniensis]KTD19696.1 proline/betaine transporter ProP6 [Legionella londiniensis]STX92394.1 putative proline/glycine betaine transporter [Legionella londiniensis]
MGNLVEAYDVSICYFLSSELSRVLVGEHQGRPTIVLTLIFLAYLAKPIGAFILGLLSDLYGRKNILTLSILIMGLSTACIGLVPGYREIGLYSVALLLSLRIIQSMALGSEFLNSASFLVESGDDKQKGFRGCWSSVGVKAGYLVACLVTELSREYLTDFGGEWFWRIPFILALLTTGIGVYIRYNMPESLAYIIYYAEREKPTTRTIYQQSMQFVKRYPFLFNYAFFASFLSVATGFFFYLYIPLHAAQYSKLSREFIITSTTISLAFVTLLIPVFGWISDKNDRLKMLTFASSGLFILAYPFMHTINFGGESQFLLLQLLISIPCACYYSVSSVLLTELFPLQIRCTALSIVFSVAASLAAGVPPLLADYLARATKLPNSPSLMMMAFSAIVLININLLHKYYRNGKNQYAVSMASKERAVFTIQYQR